jgi:threonine synthase
MLAALRESGGGAVAIPDDLLTEAATLGTAREGIDFSPEGGAAIAAARHLVAAGELDPADRIVIFNTGAGWLYRG